MDMPKYQIIIRDYLNSGCKNLEKLKKLGSKNNIMHYLNRYKEVFPNRTNEIDYVIDNYDSLYEMYRLKKDNYMYIKIINECISGEKDALKKLRHLGSKESVLHYLKNYLILYPDKVNEISELKERLYNPSYKVTPKYIMAINNYLNGVSKNFLEIYLLGDKSKILRCLRQYINRFPENAEKVNYIIDNIDGFMTFKSSEDELKRIFEVKLKNKAIAYMQVINEVLFISEEEALHVLVTKNISADLFGKYVKSFKDSFPLQVDEIKKLNNIYKALNEKQSNRQTGYINTTLLYKSNADVVNNELEQLNELIKSDLSIEEYCSKTGNSISSIRLICDKYRETNEDAINNILTKDTTEFKNYIKEIGKSILLDDKFDRLDYYQLTHLKYENFRDILYEELPKETVMKILRKCSKIFKSVTIPINKENELEIVNTFNGRVVSKEEKIKIFDFLEENDIPIDLYRIALKRYAYGELDLGRQKRK